NQVQSELRSHTEEIPSKRRGHRHGSRKDSEESCVCTHAMAPARYGLGLALGLVLLQTVICLQALAQQEGGAIRGRVFVSGKVVSAADGRALEGVTVSATASNNKVISNRDGDYGIPTFSDDYLTFAF